MRRVAVVLLLFGAAIGACGQSLTGHMSGSGGAPTGGSPGTGGAPTGVGNSGPPAVGQGGYGGTDPAYWCNMVAGQYQAAVAAAQSCDVAQSGQCQQMVDSALSSCGSCPTFVNDASAPRMLRQSWFDSGCDKLPSAPCTGGVCLGGANNVCVVAPGTSHGSCSYAPPDAGSPDGGPATCDTLTKQYADALAAARSCTPGAAGQCGYIVAAALTTCTTGCAVLVTDMTQALAIRQAWIDAGCASVPAACPAIACDPLVGGWCAGSDGGSGTCASTYGPSQ